MPWYRNIEPLLNVDEIFGRYHVSAYRIIKSNIHKGNANYILNIKVNNFTENGKVMGYLYWSVLDNFEWDLGYKMNFGLVEVDKNDYSRKPHKSAYWFGNISKTNNLSN